jgi:hypothetical protein
MKVKPVQNYEGAKYPTLVEHLQKKGKKGKYLKVALAAGLAALATLLSGCGAIDIRLH